MRNGWRPPADVKGTGTFFDDSIAHGHTLVEAQVFSPRFDDESFEIATRISGIAIQTRAERSVSQTLLPYSLHGQSEVLRLLRKDSVLDHDEHRALLGIGRDCQNRLRQVTRGPQIQLFTFTERKAHYSGQTYHQSHSCAQERHNDSGTFRYHSPDDASERHAALKS